MKTRGIVIITLLLLVAALGMSQQEVSAKSAKKYTVEGTVKTISGNSIVKGKVVFQDVGTGKETNY